MHGRCSLLGCVLRQASVVAVVALLGLFAAAPAASAHGGPANKEGYILVQQALGLLAKSTSAESVHLAMAKVDAALAAEDHDGVAVTEVKQAKRALEAGRIEPARVLLQHSIKVALSELGSATGEQTGTTVVTSELPGRKGLTGGDWVLLAGCMVVVLAGIGLAFRFRPHDTVGELHRRLGVSPVPGDKAAGDPSRVETEL